MPKLRREEDGAAYMELQEVGKQTAETETSVIKAVTQSPDPALRRYKAWWLWWLFMCQSAWACSHCLDGPATPDIRERLGITMEQFARTHVLYGIGIIVGSILAGMVVDRFLKYINLVIAFSFLGLGVTSLLKPWSPSVDVLCILAGINGIAGGFYTCTTSVHFALFGSEIMPMYVRHLGWTLTCPFIPLLAKDFLSDPVAPNQVYNSTNMTTPASPPTPWYLYGDRSRIEIPYAICAAVSLMLVPVFCYYQWATPPPSYQPKHKEKTSWKEVFSPGSCAGGSAAFGLSTAIGLMFFFVFLVAADNPKWTLEFSYAIDPRGGLNMSKDTAAYLTSASQGAHLLSRLASIALSYWVPGLRIETLMLVCVVGTTAASGVYVFAGLRHAAWMWTGTVALEVFQQVLWPGGLLWAESYIHVYQVIISTTTIAQGASGMVAGWLNGHLYDKDPVLPFHVSFVFACFNMVTFFVMVALARWFSKSYPKSDMELIEHEYTQALLTDEDDDELNANCDTQEEHST